ncbi:MAG: hypothetical protein ACK53C_06645 [Pseudomonadota bacterium]
MKLPSWPWFTVGFCVAYPLVFARDWALFLYYPVSGRFHWGNAAQDVGPPMHWYGLVATAALAGLVVAMVGRDAWLTPRVLRWATLTPCIAMFGALILLRQFFL